MPEDPPDAEKPPTGRAMTGVVGLDDVLEGGFVRGRVYLVEGQPGTGKTTLAMQFLLQGARQGERVLYCTLSETASELTDGAASHGWSLDGVVVTELVPADDLVDPGQRQTLLHSSDLELGETTRAALDAVERLRPHRVVLDSLSEIRLLAQSSLRYRRQILALKHYFSGHGATVLLLDDMTTEPGDRTVHSIAHGVLRLEELVRGYGAQRRRLRVIKYRASRFRGGYHDFTILTGGVRVFPRLIAAEHRRAFVRTTVTSGNAELDQLLGGGVERGTGTLLIGPAGCGKSLVGFHFLAAALARGERALALIFDEELSLLTDRTRALGIDLDDLQRRGLVLEKVDAAELSPGELATRVRALVEDGVGNVLLDGLNGYKQAMPGEQNLILHMHELLQFTARHGVMTFLTVAQHGLVGDMKAPVDVTYLADTIILLRYFEAMGRVRRAMSVIKKRSGWHEDTVREFRIDTAGIRLGGPLQEFQGVLRGVPTYLGQRAPLLSDDSS